MQYPILICLGGVLDKLNADDVIRPCFAAFLQAGGQLQDRNQGRLRQPQRNSNHELGCLEGSRQIEHFNAHSKPFPTSCGSTTSKTAIKEAWGERGGLMI